ncbi:MAG: cytochrome C, partial [Methylotenera sp.]|nr:cytochrome C [Methylotenera sp.]
MTNTKLNLLLMILLVALCACGKKDKAPIGADTTATEVCSFVSTKDNRPLAIKVVASDTPEAKEFLTTCKNPYTKLYANNAEAAKAGKKQFSYQGCSGC